MTRSIQSLLAGPVLAAAALAGCASQPDAQKGVYVVEGPLADASVGGTPVAAAPVRERRVICAPEVSAPERADVSEADRRAWVEANYGWRPAAVAVEPAPDAEVSEQYAPVRYVRERVVYEDRDPRWYDYLPPISFGLSYFDGHGHGHHGHDHGGWGWGLSTGWPGYGW